MSVKCINNTCNIEQMEEFMVYCGRRATGVMLAAVFLCCLMVIPSIELPHKEGLAVSTPESIKNVDLFNPMQRNALNILDTCLQEAAIPSDTTKPLPLLKKESRIPAGPISSEFPDRPIYLTGETGKVGEGATTDIPDIIPNPVPDTTPEPIPNLTYAGTLRMNYCVGSDIDLANIVIYYGSDILRAEELGNVRVDTQTSGNKILEIAYANQKVKIPYGVVEYTVQFHGNGGTVNCTEALLYNYQLDTSTIGMPARLGKKFTGWYRDEACTIPFAEAMPGEVSLDLYAGWIDITKFSCDDNGIITGFNGTIEDITDGVLVLPNHKDFQGAAAGAFGDLNHGVWEVYIPANITYVEPEAFDGLSELMFIYVDTDNPTYYSEGGILYARDGGIEIVYPKGQLF